MLGKLSPHSLAHSSVLTPYTICEKREELSHVLIKSVMLTKYGLYISRVVNLKYCMWHYIPKET